MSPLWRVLNLCLYQTVCLCVSIYFCLPGWFWGDLSFRQKETRTNLKMVRDPVLVYTCLDDVIISLSLFLCSSFSFSFSITHKGEDAVTSENTAQNLSAEPQTRKKKQKKPHTTSLRYSSRAMVSLGSSSRESARWNPNERTGGSLSIPKDSGQVNKPFVPCSRHKLRLCSGLCCL